MDRIDHNGVILKIHQLSSEVAEATIHCPSVASAARPGQFIMVRQQGVLDPLLGRPLAVAAVNGETITLLFQIVGKFTSLFASLPPGSKMNLRGPIGNGYLSRPSQNKHILLVAGTLGAAPLLFAFQNFSLCSRSDFVLGVPGKGWEGFVRYTREKVSRMTVCSDDGTLGIHGTALAALPDALNERMEIWACGPLPMLKALAFKYPDQKHQIRVSLDMKMACGIGGCLGCVIDTSMGPKRVCVDGPFFLASEVQWNDMA